MPTCVQIGRDGDVTSVHWDGTTIKTWRRLKSALVKSKVERLCGEGGGGSRLETMVWKGMRHLYRPDGEIPASRLTLSLTAHHSPLGEKTEQTKKPKWRQTLLTASDLTQFKLHLLIQSLLGLYRWNRSWILYIYCIIFLISLSLFIFS